MNWTFTQALECIKSGGNVQRAKWSVGSFVCLRAATERGGPKIVKRAMRGGHERVYVYQPTTQDMLATDWSAAP